MASALTLRKKARKLVMQGLYQWHVSQNSASEVQQYILDFNDESGFDVPYFNEILLGVIRAVPELDTVIAQYTSRPLNEVSPVDLAILRLSTFELMNRLDIPYRVVINEALDLSKEFGANDAFKFVNSVLDQISMEKRTLER